MRRWIAILAFTCLPGPGATIDRIAVTVGKQVITESDVMLDLRVSAFLDQKPLDASGEQKRKTADRLVDQLLIRQDAVSSRELLVPDEDIPKLLAPIKAQYASEGDYRAALERYRISEQDLIDHLRDGLRNFRFTDQRFRAEVQLSDDDLHDFYDAQAAEGQRTQTPVASFEESRDQVVEVLTEQRIMQALDRWLGMVRNETQVLYHEEAFR